MARKIKTMIMAIRIRVRIRRIAKIKKALTMTMPLKVLSQMIAIKVARQLFAIFGVERGTRREKTTTMTMTTTTTIKMAKAKRMKGNARRNVRTNAKLFAMA